MGLFLAILYGIGFYVQHFAFEALQGGPPSIDDLALGESVSLMPTLVEWLTSFLDFQILLVGFVAAVVGLHGSTPKHFAVFTGVGLAILITLQDLILHVIDGTFSGDQMVQNMVANLIGGAVAAVFAAAVLWLYEVAVSRLGSGQGYRLLAAGMVPVFATLLSVTAYYFLYFFYQPTFSRFEFVAQPPFRGYLSPYQAGAGDKGELRFTFLPGSIMTGANVTGFDGNTKSHGMHF